MMDRFTFRDFLVYFLTGFFLVITLLYKYGVLLLEHFKIDPIETNKNSAITIFLLIPGLYIIGHIIHGVDLILFKIGRSIWDLKIKNSEKTQTSKCDKIIDTLNFLINGNRIIGILNQNNQNSQVFYQRATKLQCLDKYDKSEYWQLLNDLFKGLTIITLVWSIFYIITLEYINALISLFLLFIFWYRSRHMATNFVSTLNYTWKEIENTHSIIHKPSSD